MCRFRRQAEPEQSGLCDDEAQGRLCRPEHFKPNGGPRRALPRWGMAAKARYEHQWDPSPSRAKRLGLGEEEQGSGRSFRRQAETEVSGLCDDEVELYK